MELLAYALRLQRIFAPIERLHHGEGGAHQPGVGEDAAGSSQTLVGADDDEGVDGVFRAKLLAPAALRGCPGQSDGLDIVDAHLCSRHEPSSCVRVEDGWRRSPPLPAIL
jgi:hypothetical protein